MMDVFLIALIMLSVLSVTVLNRTSGKYFDYTMSLYIHIHIILYSSVRPLSSPVSGGTLISLHVNDLPIDYNDILSVTIGSVECSLIESSFVSGERERVES